MVPTFLQKRAAGSHSLRMPVALFFLVAMALIYTAAISVIIADRSFTPSGKLAIIAILLVMALASLGLFERVRR
jgi:hypothetical protein